MVGRWGMSEAIGPVAVLPHPDEEGLMAPAGGGPSEATLQLVDDEVRRMLLERHALLRGFGLADAARENYVAQQ